MNRTYFISIIISNRKWENTCNMAVCAMTVERFGLAIWTPQIMLHKAEKSLSSFYLRVTRLMINFLCCSTQCCKSFCQLTWQSDCNLLFPIPQGIFLPSKHLDELCFLLFLLSLLGDTISQQKLFNLFVDLFVNIAFVKTSKNALQARLRRRLRKTRRRWRARFSMEQATC